MKIGQNWQTQVPKVRLLDLYLNICIEVASFSEVLT